MSSVFKKVSKTPFCFDSSHLFLSGVDILAQNLPFLLENVEKEFRIVSSLTFLSEQDHLAFCVKSQKQQYLVICFVTDRDFSCPKQGGSKAVDLLKSVFRLVSVN